MSLRFSLLACVGLFGCGAATPGAQPHDMSRAHHEKAAAAHDQEAEQHAALYDPAARKRRDACAASVIRAGAGDACWTSITNPTEKHLRAAEEHHKQAADHRAASAALKDAEARACGGVPDADRDMSPFERTEDIVSVEPLKESGGSLKGAPGERTVGVVVTFRAVPGMTAEWLQRVVDCHLARNSALGHEVPEMPNCPLVPRGVSARVTSTGNGFAVSIRAPDEATAHEVVARAERLSAGAKP